MPTAIERCVGDGAVFARETWGRAPRLYPQADPSAYADVLSVDDVDALIGTGGLRHPAFRVVREGETLPRTELTKAHTVGGRRISDAVDADAVIGAFGAGATVVLQALHRSVLPVQRFCAELEGFFGHPIQANAYLTPARAGGLSTHHDTHDVLALQLFGSKRWYLHPVHVVDPVPGHPKRRRYDQPGEPSHVWTTRAGDCLYLPRGVPHRAEGLETASLHLTLGVRSPTWLDVLERVLDRARELPDLRGSLPLGYASHPGELEIGIASMLERAAAFLRELDPAELAAAERERASEIPRASRVGRLAALARGGVDEGDE